jgi:Peptidase family C25
MPTKIIVTAQGAMKQKYGGAWPQVKKAVGRLVTADAKRGVTSTFVALDDASLGPRRAKAGDGASFKSALDFVFTQHQRPDYVLILGGPDVVPHQILENPIDDDDVDVPSDLPYACSTPAGADTETFFAPTRVVGRLPDVPGNKSAKRLVALLDAAARWKPRHKADYASSFFGLSAHVWRKSTTLSVRALFGSAARPRTSPEEGPDWKKAELAPLAHFINCHGDTIDPQFYGQKGKEYPVAQQAIGLPGKVATGTVVAAECCYGTELYEPKAEPAGICVHYLEEGAIGFMGATNTAYGPSTTNGSADLICRFFLESVLKGASLGRAMLEARLRFVREASPLSPMELKTLAQFLLLGDPSLRPVGPAGAVPKRAGAKALAFAKALSAHSARRGALSSEASMLAQGAGCVASRPDSVTPPAIRARLEQAARAAGCVPGRSAKAYRVRPGVDPTARYALARAAKGAKAMKSAKAMAAPVLYHVLVSTPTPGATATVKVGGASKAKSAKARGPAAKAPQHPRPERVSNTMVLVAREEGGKVVEVEQLFAKGAPRERHERELRRPRREEAGRPGLEERP